MNKNMFVKVRSVPKHERLYLCSCKLRCLLRFHERLMCITLVSSNAISDGRFGPKSRKFVLGVRFDMWNPKGIFRGLGL